MNEILSLEQQEQCLRGAGLGPSEVRAWKHDVAAGRFPETADSKHLDADARAVGKVIRRGWALLDRLPLRTKRIGPKKAARQTLVKLVTALCRDFGVSRSTPR
jgi:hypothetical protein